MHGDALLLCSCCGHALTTYIVDTEPIPVRVRLCAECDFRVCHYGWQDGNAKKGIAPEPGCELRVSSLTAVRCPLGHAL